MKSKVFQALTKLSGITIYNWREKMEVLPPDTRAVPTKSDPPEDLLRMSRIYFEKLIVQDEFIRAALKLLESYEAEVVRWDSIQFDHESQIAAANEKFSRSERGILINQNQILESQNKKLRNKLRNLERQQQAFISDDQAERILKHISNLEASLVGNRKSDAKKIRAIGVSLKTVLDKAIKYNAQNGIDNSSKG